MPPMISHSHNLHRSLARVLILTLVLTPLAVFGKPISPKGRSAIRPPVVESSTPVLSVLPAVAPTELPTYSAFPSSGTQGKETEVIVSQDGCVEVAGATAKLDLYAPAGSGITVSEVRQSQCQVTAKLNIASDAPLGVMKLWLAKPSTPPKSKIPTVDFSVTGITPQPIPPGLNNKGEVDVMWSVLPDRITDDNFGGKVKRQFYCIEAVIGNDSGYDLQLSSIGFTLPALANSKQRIPSTGYRTVRGSLEAFGQLAPRQFIVNGLRILGPILTGFLPFFHAVNHKANFSQAINVISNPLEKGLEDLWPDLLPTELDRLADQTFRDDVSTKTIIPNNVQARILTFVPRELVFPPKPKGTSRQATDPDPKNPLDVMKLLGEIVIVGQEITHVNRVRVVNTPFGTSVTDHSIAGKITDMCNAGVAGVTMTLTGSGDFIPREVKTSADGAYVFANVPDGRTYTVTSKMTNMKFLPTASDAFLLNDTKANLNFTADYVALTITGKVLDSDDKPLSAVGIKLSGAKSGETKTDKDGAYSLTVPAADLNLLTVELKITPTLKDYTFKPVTSNWTCKDRALDFVGTKD